MSCIKAAFSWLYSNTKVNDGEEGVKFIIWSFLSFTWIFHLFLFRSKSHYQSSMESRLFFKVCTITYIFWKDGDVCMKTSWISGNEKSMK